jgi:D-xylose transport system ATP-binding protein
MSADNGTATATPVLEVRGAAKSFGPVMALRGVDLHLGRQEILAVLGDNGAGKSTLIKAFAGVHRLDAGEILLDGEPVSLRSPADARGLGIETLYQDLAVFDNLSAVANFFIGQELTRPRLLGRLGFLRERSMAREWQRQRQQLKVGIVDSAAAIGLMSGGQRQAVAVMRAVAFASRVVILDEPTAALGLRESRQVLELIRRLPEAGVAVIVVSHNLEHVMEIADRAVVLRQGRIVGEAAPTPENHERLVALIVGAANAQHDAPLTRREETNAADFRSQRPSNSRGEGHE